jgi:hypothetical protein
MAVATGIAAMAEFTAQQKLQAIEREIQLRLRVYSRRVESSQMSRREADYQIDIMRAIALDYEQQAERERLI